MRTCNKVIFLDSKNKRGEFQLSHRKSGEKNNTL